MELKLAGETIGMVNLIAGQDVSRSSLLYSFSKLQEFFGSLYLKVVLVVSAICAIIYVAWVLLNSPTPAIPPKSPPLWLSPRLSRAASFFSEKAVKAVDKYAPKW